MTAQLDDHYHKGHIAADVELDPKPQIRIVNIKKMIENDKLTDKDVFKRTYLGHARMSSAFVFRDTKARSKNIFMSRMMKSELFCPDQGKSLWAR